MKLLLKAGALALVATPLLAQDKAPNGDMPPMEYRGDSVSAVIFTSDVGRYCGYSDDPSRVIVACAYTNKNVTIMPNPCKFADREFYALVMCHEQGHQNLWKH